MTTPEPRPLCFGDGPPKPSPSSPSPPPPKKRSNGVPSNGLPRCTALCLPPPPPLVTLMRTTDGDICEATCANVRLSERASETCSFDGGGKAGFTSACTTGAACAVGPQ